MFERVVSTAGVVGNIGTVGNDTKLACVLSLAIDQPDADTDTLTTSRAAADGEVGSGQTADRGHRR